MSWHPPGTQLDYTRGVKANPIFKKERFVFSQAPPGTQLDYTRGVEANRIKPALAYSVAFSPRLLHIVRTKTPRFTIEKPRPETQAFYDLTKCPEGTGDIPERDTKARPLTRFVAVYICRYTHTQHTHTHTHANTHTHTHSHSLSLSLSHL